VKSAVVLLVTGRYPKRIYDLVLGLDRWVLRVAAYAGLMTDTYPPFRLDMGGHEPGGTLTIAAPEPGGEGPAGSGPAGWTTARIVAAVAGAILILCSLGLLGGGGTAVWAQTTQRHGGYVDLGSTSYQSTGYAIASDTVELQAVGGWDAARAIAGTVRISVTAPSAGHPVRRHRRPRRAAPVRDDRPRRAQLVPAALAVPSPRQPARFRRRPSRARALPRPTRGNPMKAGGRGGGVGHALAAVR
jgi:hypothetical protein